MNPVSGRGATRRVVAEVCERLQQRGYAVRVDPTAGPGDAVRIVERCCDGGHRAVVVVGGDGTVNDAVGGLTGGGVPILIVPSGTENILAKCFGTKLNAAWLVDTLEGGRTTRLDVGLMNGRRFLMVAGAGFDAECVRRVTLARRGRITYADYFWPIWRAFWSYRHPHLTVEADGERIFDGRGLAIVGNVRRYAWDLRLAARAVADDGRLDVCVFACEGQGKLLWQAAKVAARRHVGSRGVTYRQARQIRIASKEPVGVEVDGDWAGMLPAEFSVAERKAEFCVSPYWAW